MTTRSSNNKIRKIRSDTLQQTRLSSLVFFLYSYKWENINVTAIENDQLLETSSEEWA